MFLLPAARAVARAVAAVAACGLLLPAQPVLAAKRLPPFDPELEQEVAGVCTRWIAEGVFNCESLACFPRVRQEVEGALCSVDLGELWLPFAAGFGYGARYRKLDLDPARVRGLPFVRYGVDPTAWSAWRAEHCGDTEPATSLEVGWDVGQLPKGGYDLCAFYQAVEHTQEVFAAARAAAPRQLAEPWQRCLDFEQRCRIGKPGGVLCRLIGTSGEADETVYFTVLHILDPDQVQPLLLPLPLRRYFAPKLRHDLEIVGAECEGPQWLEGMRVKGQHTLRCRRLGPGAVTFRLVTSKGECTETLPELGDPPWQETCSGVDRTPLGPVLPFLIPAAPEHPGSGGGATLRDRHHRGH